MSNCVQEQTLQVTLNAGIHFVKTYILMETLPLLEFFFQQLQAVQQTQTQLVESHQKKLDSVTACISDSVTACNSETH
jgi:hypothetical protein